jgi:hypothetical protein
VGCEKIFDVRFRRNLDVAIMGLKEIDTIEGFKDA